MWKKGNMAHLCSMSHFAFKPQQHIAGANNNNNNNSSTKQKVFHTAFRGSFKGCLVTFYNKKKRREKKDYYYYYKWTIVDTYIRRRKSNRHKFPAVKRGFFDSVLISISKKKNYKQEEKKNYKEEEEPPTIRSWSKRKEEASSNFVLSLWECKARQQRQAAMLASLLSIKEIHSTHKMESSRVS